MSTGYEHPIYTAAIFGQGELNKTVRAVVKRIRALPKEFRPEALAATGNSGLPLVGAVAYSLRLPLIAVRRRIDSSHDNRWVNGFIGCRQYIIIDDLISSGWTVRHIIKKISEAARRHDLAVPRPAAIVLYDCDDRTHCKTYVGHKVTIFNTSNMSNRIFVNPY